MARRIRTLASKSGWVSATYGNGLDAFNSREFQVCTTANDRVADPFFPPQVALYLVKLACQRPDTQGRSLSQWDSVELARQLVTTGIVSSISPQTTRRILSSHRLKP